MFPAASDVATFGSLLGVFSRKMDENLFPRAKAWGLRLFNLHIHNKLQVTQKDGYW